MNDLCSASVMCHLTSVRLTFDLTKIETSPVVSNDNSLLFITGASDEMYCVQADSGSLQWAHDGGEIGFVAKPVFRDGGGYSGVVFAITVRNLMNSYTPFCFAQHKI